MHGNLFKEIAIYVNDGIQEHFEDTRGGYLKSNSNRKTNNAMTKRQTMTGN